jgi:uncharacterized protein YigA (DUF484 family)
MNAQDVADYLQQHPEFFEEHAALFAALTVPHPHGGRAIPLAERQMITLREKNRALELKVAELMRYGQENDAIAERLARWTRLLLLQRSPRLLPETLTGSLEEIFAVPHVALAIWEAADDQVAGTHAEAATPALIGYVQSLAGPYCGAVDGDAKLALPLFRNALTERTAVLSQVTADGVAVDGATASAAEVGSDIRSVALIPLRRGAAPAAFGLLALGSADARRFHAGMGTDFLARIGETSSAALSKLLK